MTETFDEHQRRISATRTAGNKQDDIHKIRLAIQASVAAKLLTNDENWDVYLRYVQHAVDMIDQGITARKEQLEDHRVVNQDLFMQIKIALVDLQGQKLALEWAMTLPKTIKETGEIAKDLHDKVPV